MKVNLCFQHFMKNFVFIPYRFTFPTILVFYQNIIELMIGEYTKGHYSWSQEGEDLGE